MMARLVLACGIVALAFASAPDARAQRASAGSGRAALSVVVSVGEPNGSPMRRASVSLQASELGVPRTAVTDDEGRVLFDGLPPGNYLVSAAKPGYVRTFYGSRLPGRGPGVAVALVGGQRIEIRVGVPRGGVISGVVRTISGRPAANLTVQALHRSGVRHRPAGLFTEGSPTWVQTDDRGMYRIFGLPPGDYVVSARSPIREEVRVVTEAELRWADGVLSGAAGAGRGSPAAPGGPRHAPLSTFAPVYYPGTPVVADASTITLAAGEERLGVDFALSLVPTAVVRGRLIDMEGRPQPGQPLILRPLQPAGTDVVQLVEAALGQTTRTGPGGAFSLAAVRPGRYSLEVRATPRPSSEPPVVSERPVPPVAGGAGTHWAKAEIVVSGEDIADLTLMLKPGLTVSGRVVYDGSMSPPPQGPASQMFRLIPADSDPGAPPVGMAGEARIRVDANGTFSATGIAPGRYRLVTPAALLGAMMGAGAVASAAASAGGWVLKSAVAGGRDIADGVLELADGASVSDVVVTFTDRATALSGQVFDPAGRATADFPIVIFSTDRRTWLPASRRVHLVRPATDGRFLAVGLPAGEYYVAAVTAIEPDQLADPTFLEQLAAMSFTLTLADGEKKTQDLKLGGG